MSHKEITAHTTDGDQLCEVYGDLTVGEATLKANILIKYPTATFTVVVVG